MSPKVTLSVPDDLFEKIEKWKGSFNLSKIFQRAIAEAIENKENFQKRLKEEPTMDAIIERLRKEKEEESMSYHELGKQNGLEWAKSASYSDLQYALKWETVAELPGNTIGWDPTTDEVLGEYFGGVIQRDLLMGFDETGRGHLMPNEYFQAWETGWKEAVEEFWKEVEGRI
jgi:hypothetical protein